MLASYGCPVCLAHNRLPTAADVDIVRGSGGWLHHAASGRRRVGLAVRSARGSASSAVRTGGPPLTKSAVAVPAAPWPTAAVGRQRSARRSGSVRQVAPPPSAPATATIPHAGWSLPVDAPTRPASRPSPGVRRRRPAWVGPDAGRRDDRDGTTGLRDAPSGSSPARKGGGLVSVDSSSWLSMVVALQVPRACRGPVDGAARRGRGRTWLAGVR